MQNGHIDTPERHRDGHDQSNGNLNDSQYLAVPGYENSFDDDINFQSNGSRDEMTMAGNAPAPQGHNPANGHFVGDPRLYGMSPGASDDYYGLGRGATVSGPTMRSQIFTVKLVQN